jgi:hypothetical protein
MKKWRVNMECNCKKIDEKYIKFYHFYFKLIEELKIKMAIDEGWVDEETKTLLKQARAEIVMLRKQLKEK